MRGWREQSGLLVPDDYQPPGLCSLSFEQMLMAANGGRSTYPITTTGLLWVLDAGNSASYPGSGTTWANVWPTPADGSAQTDYDTTQGDGSTSSTYPTFTGSVGSTSAYWAFDGGDYFRRTAANTTFLNSMSKDSAVFTLMLVYQLGSTASFQTLYSTGRTTADSGINYGGFNSTNKNSIGVLRAVGGTTALNKEQDSTLSSGTWYIEFLSLDETGNGFFWRNGSYAQVGGSDTFSATYSSPSAANSNRMAIGAAVGSGINEYLSNNSRVAYSAGWNIALSVTQVTASYNGIKARWGL